MLSSQITVDLSPEPILSAVDAYRGTIVDLDHDRVIEPGAFALGRQTLARRMSEHGLDAGDRVIIAVGNGPLFITALTAILARGGSPLLVHAETPLAELKRTALRFGARFILADCWEEDGVLVAGLVAKTISHDSWIHVAWAEIDTSEPSFEGRYPSLPGVPLHPTSGTTGQPKVAVRPGAAAVAEARHYIETIGIDKSDAILTVAPMSHAYAYGMCVMVPLLSGADVVTMRRFGPKLVHRACQDHRITILPAVPVMLDNLLFGAGDKLYDPSRRVFSAGAPLPERTALAFQKKSGSIVRPLYGTTETGGISVAAVDETMAIGPCVGRPMNGVSVQVRPAEEAASLSEGVGRLFVHASSMMAGYLGHKGVDCSPLADGWFETGDLARVDQHGAIHLLGRETDVINVFGMKVIPSEVEEVIASLAGVAEVKVYAGRRRSGSQQVKAAVVANGTLDETTIRDHCQSQLVYYKRPEKIMLLDALPKTPTGKIIRDQLP